MKWGSQFGRSGRGPRALDLCPALRSMALTQGPPALDCGQKGATELQRASLSASLPAPPGLQDHSDREQSRARLLTTSKEPEVQGCAES